MEEEWDPERWEVDALVDPDEEMESNYSMLVLVPGKEGGGPVYWEWYPDQSVGPEAGPERGGELVCLGGGVEEVGRTVGKRLGMWVDRNEECYY